MLEHTISGDIGAYGLRFELRGAQLSIHSALLRKCPRLAQWYFAALRTLEDGNNSDRLAQAAHSIREIMDKFPECAGQAVFDVSGDASQTVRDLKALVDELGPNEAIGPADDDRVNEFINAVRERISSFCTSRIPRRAQAERVFRDLAPGG